MLSSFEITHDHVHFTCSCCICFKDFVQESCLENETLRKEAFENITFKKCCLENEKGFFLFDLK